MWYVITESIEMGVEEYYRKDFNTFEEAQAYYERTPSASKPQKA